jgi:hypothetical protein
MFEGIKKIFEKKEIETPTLEPKLAAGEIIEKTAEIKKKALEEYEEYRKKMEKLSEKTKNFIKDAQKNENSILNPVASKIISSAAKTVLPKLLEIIENSVPEKAISIEDAKKKSFETAEKIRGGVIGIYKSIAYASHASKDEMKEIGALLEEMVKESLKVNKTLSVEGINLSEKAMEYAGEIILLEESEKKEQQILEELLKQSNAHEEKIIEAKTKVIQAEKSEEKKTEKDLELRSKEIINEKIILKNRIYSETVAVQRALEKVATIGEETDYVEALYKSPYFHLKKEGVEKFKQVVNKALEASKSGRMGFGEKDTQKLEYYLEEAKKSTFFDEALKKMDELEKEGDELSKKLEEFRKNDIVFQAQKEESIVFSEKKENENKIESQQKKLSTIKTKLLEKKEWLMRAYNITTGKKAIIF